MTIREFKQLNLQKLKNSPSASLDLDVLLMHILDCDRTFLLLHDTDVIPQEKIEWLQNAVSKRTTGLPIAYITGSKEFYGYSFNVSPSVLIPKPDTEILVEETLSKIKSVAEKFPSQNIQICDMCTGSGCVAVSSNLSSEFSSRLNFTMADISPHALEVAKSNVEKYSLTNCELVQTNLFQNIQKKFHIITANPPYIPKDQTTELLLDGRSEPRLALDGDVLQDGKESCSTDGLEIMRRLVPQAFDHLLTEGWFLTEAGEYNAEETQKIFIQWGFKNTKILPDLEGQLRVIIGQKA